MNLTLYSNTNFSTLLKKKKCGGRLNLLCIPEHPTLSKRGSGAESLAVWEESTCLPAK